MEKQSLRRIVVLALHLLTWVLMGFALMFYQPLSWGVKLPQEFWIKQVCNIALLAVLFYVNALVIVPRTLLRNKIIVFIFWIACSVFVMLTASRQLDHNLQVSRKMDRVMPRPRPQPPRKHVDGFLLMTTLLVLGISTSLAVIQRWQRDARLRDAVEKQNISSELALLKAQINPHFFFNTLNNIYALTYTDVPVSRDAILKLSRMMRYLLYETQHDTALLSQEIMFVEDYIALMRLRIQQSTSITFLEPELDKDYPIAPMLLLPFIENAFKHGVSVVQQSSIDIKIAAMNNVLLLHVGNTIFRDSDPLQQGGGIGMANTRRRLDLLYPNRHSLEISENAATKTYFVNLTIELQAS